MATRPILGRKEAPAAKKPAKAQPKEFFKFKYFRFKCRDAAKTIDFYKSCGMNLDFDGEQESFRPVVLTASQKTAAGKTMESTHMKKVAATKEETAEEDKGPQGRQMGRVFGLSYSAVVGAALSNRIQLIFEEWVENPELDSLVKKDPDGEEKKEERKSVNPLKRNVRQYEYLVIYVHFLARLVKRMQAKAYEVALDVTVFDGVKMAILKDPNNIQWFARLGYYTIPTSFADSTVMLYESLFQVRIPKPASKVAKEKDAKDKPEDSSLVPVNLRKLGPSQTAKLALAKGTGFRIVDMDELIVGLMDSVFFWMGNDVRTNTCCVCFTEVSNADTGEAYTVYSQQESPLVAIGFEVPNIDTVIAKLKHETKDGLVWDPLRYKMAKYGTNARFVDKINGISLDLLCTKLEQPPLVGKAAQRYHASKPLTLNSKANAEPGKDEVDWIIDFNHLRGHARILSEGAVKNLKGYGYDIRKDHQAAPDDHANAKNGKPKKLISIFRNENEGA
ncbi:hypothetical protein HDU91_003435 [Kappamyces sp. JEL0680]|nr:hypothetical protein HDU91_003435 [Kappamyces sp. JEL0680]